MAKQPKDEKNASDFMKLYQNDFTDSIMEKGTQKISYIPWASAWAEVKKVFPDASFEKHLFDVRDPKGECPMYQVPYLKDKQGYCYVVVTVTINGIHRRRRSLNLHQIKMDRLKITRSPKKSPHQSLLTMVEKIASLPSL